MSFPGVEFEITANLLKDVEKYIAWCEPRAAKWKKYISVCEKNDNKNYETLKKIAKSEVLKKLNSSWFIKIYHTYLCGMTKNEYIKKATKEFVINFRKSNNGENLWCLTTKELAVKYREYGSIYQIPGSEYSDKDICQIANDNLFDLKNIRDSILSYDKDAKFNLSWSQLHAINAIKNEMK